MSARSEENDSPRPLGVAALFGGSHSPRDPVPGIAPNAGPVILQGLELQRLSGRPTIARIRRGVLGPSIRDSPCYAPSTRDDGAKAHHPSRVSSPRDASQIRRNQRSVPACPLRAVTLLADHHAVGRRRRQYRVADVDIAANRVRHIVLGLRVPALPGCDADRDRHPVRGDDVHRAKRPAYTPLSYIYDSWALPDYAIAAHRGRSLALGVATRDRIAARIPMMTPLNSRSA